MAAEMAQKLVDTTLEQCPAPRWVGITVFTVSAVCLALHLVRSYALSNRLDLFKRALEGAGKVYKDSLYDLHAQKGRADRIWGELER
jgi:hypothetical protein